MYVYVFSSYYGGDKVAIRPDAADLGMAAGDLIKTDMSYVLCLWETCAFQELIKHTFVPHGEPKILLKSVVSQRTLHVIYQFVQHRYTTYHKAMALWIWPDDLVEWLVRYAPAQSVLKTLTSSKKKPKELETQHLQRLSDEARFSPQLCTSSGQQLILVPDLRTLRAIVPHELLEQKNIVILHSQSTDKQKREAYRNLKIGKKHILISTPSQCFQDRYALSQITVVDQHKRRYKNQQDPRYDAVTVVQHLAAERWASLQLTGITL